HLEQVQHHDNAPEIATRLAYFCSGCPHNSSTRLPEGSRAYAGIGCHFMVQWMDRETLGFTHMGGEGVNWIGEAPFSRRDHVFQNLGDGTYNHSGVQAIRAALAAQTNITFKILFNDAVAMTGGQPNDGNLSPEKIARELNAMGVGHVAIIHDEKETIDRPSLPRSVQCHTRSNLMSIQEKYSKIKGVSAIIYVQTCAAEKRRRRKRGLFPDPDKRVFINPEICEGCGDCGVQSNCVSIVPLETPLGRKRAIDQSSCNKDFSCLDGFCPAMVTVSGANIRKTPTREIDLPALPEPELPAISGTYNFVITGVGGTGVVTIGAVLAMAAHIEGLGAGMMEMAGLAQKGGAVNIHCRVAQKPEDINAIRVATGEADAIIGGDLVVSAGAHTLGLTLKGRTRAVVNSHEIITGEFTRNTEFTLPSARLTLALQARLGEENVDFLDVSALSRTLLGDSIFSNMMVFGAAWQKGLVPIGRDSILKAIELNGAAVKGNRRAFDLGRWAILEPEAARALLADDETEAAAGDAVAFRAAALEVYQNAAYAARFMQLVNRAEGALREAIAKGYHKLLAYKDEYEVARLHATFTERHLKTEFEGDLKPVFNLAPPLLSRPGPDGRPKKRAFGPWILPVFRLLARLKRVRGTPFDVFCLSAERQMERALIRTFEADMNEVLNALSPETMEIAVKLAELPLSIRGFGPVKMESVAAYHKQREKLLGRFRAGGGAPKRVAAE
ncbi:MAG: indolepyruvate ferredoxin oxidoreductase family protein, partial [Paracoccaceae bacterium]